MPKNRVRVFHQGRTMSSINSISPDKLARLIGVPHCPALIDVRTDRDYEADPRFLKMLIGYEDQNFAEHHGVDYKAMVPGIEKMNAAGISYQAIDVSSGLSNGAIWSERL